MVATRNAEISFVITYLHVPVTAQYIYGGREDDGRAQKTLVGGGWGDAKIIRCGKLVSFDY